jgi:hypothetical protein
MLSSSGLREKWRLSEYFKITPDTYKGDFSSPTEEGDHKGLGTLRKSPRNAKLLEIHLACVGYSLHMPVRADHVSFLAPEHCLCSSGPRVPSRCDPFQLWGATLAKSGIFSLVTTCQESPVPFVSRARRECLSYWAVGFQQYPQPCARQKTDTSCFPTNKS